MRMKEAVAAATTITTISMNTITMKIAAVAVAATMTIMTMNTITMKYPPQRPFFFWRIWVVPTVLPRWKKKSMHSPGWNPL